MSEILDQTNKTVKAMAGIRETADSIDMQCLPIYSIIMAMGNPTINYFSLDIEGAEFQVKLYCLKILLRMQ